MKEIFAWDEELFASVLYYKSLLEKPTFGLNVGEYSSIRRNFIDELKTRNIKIIFWRKFAFGVTGCMHGFEFIYDNISLEKLIELCKNSSQDKEITNLIWNEELICKVANIDTDQKKLKLK